MPQIYIHIKTGNEYLVLTDSVVNATNAQNGEVMVLYTPNTNDPNRSVWYIRLKSEFDAKFKLKEQ